ncbi:hypothetical protein MARPU_13515 [Marichromatium purpuratum 984]|uniref:Uncharacterized protein n=1 Tax=Marichromatium purpuratum 984 TaxID=765910 RepID=W0E5E3_MARPU|nr:hypothetical protein [Marichromatium purpuratum]AHF04748.1 hypothetical protein MARPU_13515 [Marichromatium purpuratum 984]
MLGFIRNAIILSAIALALLMLTLSWAPYGLKPRLWQLNELLAQDQAVAEYPYDFRVLTFLNGVATVTSPRASTVEESRYLGWIDPTLGNGDASAQAQSLRTARERLSYTELYVLQLLLSQSDVDSVVWALDRAWFNRHGVKLPPQAEPGLPRG